MFQYKILWTHEVNNPNAGGKTLRGKLAYRDTNKYDKPHQGYAECERRRTR